MSSVPIADSAERALARDPSRSVIVQAPAGSGKTELLMQRYLALLGRVAEPEEILAVTFTRKAAAEMRHRVIGALYPQPSDKPLLPETAELATAALQRARECNWRLNDFPGRLRIRTLDSVNSWLTGAAPLSGEGTTLGGVTEQPAELYELAARRSLELLTDDSALGARVGLILGHLDNRADLFVRLFAQMLGSRDQWLPLLGRGGFDAGTRRLLEATLHELISRELGLVEALLAVDVRIELLELLQYAADNLQAAGEDDSLEGWLHATAFPAAEPEQLSLWRSLAGLLLTKSGSLRKSVNVKNGFPPASGGGDKQKVERAKALLAELAALEGAEAGLQALQMLPDPSYSEEQWETLQAMLSILPIVAAQLIVVFRERGETDYIQVASEALQALHDETGPTGLALRLDYRISHILIDEFQDTSRTQYRLLEALTEGWAEGDGRTLFVVGDPMQSIYRFRQAEVALFLQLAEQGIGQLRLETVQLTCNFRSDPHVIDWVNTVFDQLMPEHSDPGVGAVQFAPGTAVNPAEASACVELHALHDPPRVDEAVAIAELVERKLSESATDSIGILVRTRNQARLIVPELRRRGIAFAGEGLEKPGETAVEQDLIALTRALTHCADRTAWLALLRAPWCGLSLVDLEALCGTDWHVPVFDQMRDSQRLARLSEDGRARLGALVANLEQILALRGVRPLGDWVEGAWQQLGGPALLEQPRDLRLARQFFGRLDEFNAGGNIAAAFDLHERLAERADDEADQARVHLLTLYKAKGLEYDVVILPALDGITRGDDKPVMAWHQLARDDGSQGFLMAPVEATGADHDPVHRLIRQFQSEQAAYERDRLLYVATTRARRELHLFFGLKQKTDGELARPRAGTLLERLWPVIETRYADYAGGHGSEETREDWLQPFIRRVPTGWQPPAPPDSVRLLPGLADDEVEEREISYEWAGSDAPRVGNVVHRCLEFMAEQRKLDWSDSGVISLMLQEAGVADADLDAAVTKVAAALAGVSSDAQGRWLLEAHAEAASEKPVTVVAGGEVRHLVIDRTFVDSDGVRWIVDYKTSSHEGGDLEGFISEEERRYREQLEGYRQAMQMLEPDREIRTALYFPLLQRLHEIRFDN